MANPAPKNSSTDPTRPAAGSWWPGLGLVVLVALSRLPFLGPGFGSDTDGWKLACAARDIARTGLYTASRFPGYPVQEYLCAPFSGGPAWVTNGLTALFAIACVLLIHRLFRRLGGREAFWAALAFAFIPTVYISSVSAMDYLWGLAFALAAFEAALDGRAVRAGVLLGLAVGSRVTSAGFVLPLAMLLAARPGPRVRPVAVMSALGAAIGVAFYIPAYLRYGERFFGYVEPGGHSHSGIDFITGVFQRGGLEIPPSLVAAQATVLVWGVLGTVAIGVALLLALLRRRGGAAGETALPALPRGVTAAAAAVVLFELASYLRLPHDEGYLIPALPFALLLLARICPRSMFRAVAVAVIVSPFVLGVDVVPPKKGLAPLTRSPLARELRAAGQRVVVDPLRGQLLMDHDKRVRSTAIVERVRAVWDRYPPTMFLMVGTLTSELTYYIHQEQDHLRYLDLLGRTEVRERLDRGEPVYYLPDLPERVERIAGYDLRAAGVRPLFPDDPSEAPARTPRR